MTIQKRELEFFTIRNCHFVTSKYHRGRYECYLYGKAGLEITKWIREMFGEDDDLVYSIDSSYSEHEYTSLITREQLNLLSLRWS